jgi:WD40 repeat protein
VYRGHPGRVAGLAFLPDRRLVSAGEALRVWNLDAEPDVRTLAWAGDGEGDLAVSPDGRLVAVGPRFGAGGGDTPAVVYDADGAERQRLATGPGVAFNPRSGRLAAARPGGGAGVWDVADGRAVWDAPTPGTATARAPAVRGGRAVAVSKDGVVAAWDSLTKAVHLWREADGTHLGSLPVSGYVFSLAFAPDGARLIAAASEGVAVWSVADRTRVEWGEGRVWATAACFAPDGKLAATVEKDGAVCLRDAATGRAVRRLVGSGVRATAACFGPDGSRLATGGADRAVRVWDVETGRELLALPGADAAATAVVWDRAADRIYTLDHAVRVWEAGGRTR